jgi:hypothetical protein
MGYESFNDELLARMLISVILSFFLLPCGLAHVVFGFTDDTMNAWGGGGFILVFVYFATVLSLQVLFIRSRRWWLFYTAMGLLLLGAGGCASFANTISIKM